MHVHTGLSETDQTDVSVRAAGVWNTIRHWSSTAGRPCLKIGFTADIFLSQYFRDGVMPPSKILHADSTSETECTSQKTGQNCAYAACTKPHIFPTLGAPSPERGQISACSHRRPIGGGIC